MMQRERQGGAANVDDKKPGALQPRQAPLSERCDGGRVGHDCAAHSARSAGWAEADCRYPSRVQRGIVYFEHGVPVASTSERSAAPQYDLLLLWAMGGGWDPAADSGGPLWAMSGPSRASGGPQHLSHRQPKCEECRKRGRGVDPPGFDAGKQVKGKKRHLLVDTLGLVVHALVHPANIQDRDGGILLFTALADRFPLLAKLFADGAYQGPVFRQALAKVRPQLTVEIVTRRDQVKRFVVLPKRWIVERSIAWLNRCRRLAKDFENR